MRILLSLQTKKRDRESWRVRERAIERLREGGTECEWEGKNGESQIKQIIKDTNNFLQRKKK